MIEGTPAPPHPPSMAATELTHATASRDCRCHTPGRTGRIPSPPSPIAGTQPPYPVI